MLHWFVGAGFSRKHSTMIVSAHDFLVFINFLFADKLRENVHLGHCKLTIPGYIEGKVI